MTERKKTLIMGAGGRDFHVFNTCYRDDPASEVVAFTAAQIPHIDDRTYPAVLAGSLYPDGVPILPEEELERLIREHGVDEVVFAYSDVSNEFVQSLSDRVTSAGAHFVTFDIDRTMLEGAKPCVAVCAVRTGCGKSPLSRHIASVLWGLKLRPAVIRHPMPYGDLRRQVVQRFEKLDDLRAHACTIEEMEEYEPHIEAGNVVFAGADYKKVLAAAEHECDIVLWDGGNNDTPFVRPDLHITVVDPLRVGDELHYFPGLQNLERADVVVISKTNQATESQIEEVRRNIERCNNSAIVLEGRSPLEIDHEELVRGKRALVIEDGPTATHGGMGYGAGFVAALAAGVSEVVDPRPHATGALVEVFEKYKHLRAVLPALGYGKQQIDDLAQTIERADCDVVVIGTPIDLSRLIEIKKPVARVTYSFEEAGRPMLPKILEERFG